MITRGDDFSKEKSFVFDPKQDLRSLRLFMKVHYGFYNLLVRPLGLDQLFMIYVRYTSKSRFRQHSFPLAQTASCAYLLAIA